MSKRLKGSIRRKIKAFIFGVKARGEKITFSNINSRTVYPKEQPSFFDWAKEYRVSCAHKNKPVHF